MDIATGVFVAKTAADLMTNEDLLNKSLGLMGMLFPYAGLKHKAIDMYIKEIEKSDLPTETKVFMILDIKKTFKKIKKQKAIAEIAINNAEQGTDFTENPVLMKRGLSVLWIRLDL